MLTKKACPFLWFLKEWYASSCQVLWWSAKYSVKQTALKYILWILNHSCLQSNLHLISSPCRWSYFIVRHWHWLSFFILFSSSWLTVLRMSMQLLWCDLFSWLKRGFIYAKCKIEDQELYWSLPVLLDRFWRNVILFDILFIRTLLFLLCINTLVIVIVSAFTDWNCCQPHHVFSYT